jgi:hypothetical protein
MRACAEEHGPGIAIIGDSHGIDLFNGMYLAAPVDFLVGVTSNCRPYTPRPECPYHEFADFVGSDPEVFGTVIYTQAGYRLLETNNGITGSRIFERVLAVRNDVGLLSEEYDPASRRLLGNFPQAYMHVSLINSSLYLAHAEGREIPVPFLIGSEGA